MSKNKLIDIDWIYQVNTQVYAVLSCVSSKDLLKKLDKDKDCGVDLSLVKEEKCLKQIEKKMIKKHIFICMVHDRK